MNKIAAGLSVTGMTALVSLVGVSAAHADDYVDNNNPSGSQVRSSNVSGSQGAATAGQGVAPAAGGLPSTGGPDEGLLISGAALLLAGGASVVVVRRRRNA